MKRRLVLLPLLGLLALGYAAKCPKQRTSPGREIMCYTTTTDVKLVEDAICRCTTLVHQGHDLKNLFTSGIEEFQKSLKEMNPILQIVLSINDAEGSLKTSARIRQEAAARIVRFMNEVDGIELNVTAGAKERLVHFVRGLKTEMVRKAKDKRILMVLPTRPEELAKQFDLKALSKYVDLFVLPTHYLVDDEEAFRTFHPSRLMGLFDMLNTDNLVDLVSGLGAEKRKILVSLPASVYKFILEKNDENSPRVATKEKLPVQMTRSEMCDTMNEGEWIIERDEDLTAPYAFKDDTWIAFEDKISVGIKGKYVLLRDLAGLGIHNVEKDSKSKCGNSLTEDVYHSFTDNKRKTREAVLTSLQEDLQQTQSPSSGHVKSSGFRIVRVVDTDGHIHAMRENTQTEFSCPRQGYFVHPKSCNRFYRCVKFNQGLEDYSVFEFDCPAGLAFDESTEVCVWPGSISACSGSSEIAPSKGEKFTCPDHPGYYADPHNCRFFYACFDLGEHELTAYEFRCPYGLLFDEQKLSCEWPYLVTSCGGGNYERHDYAGSGHTESNKGGHGGSNPGGHGGYGGVDQGGHGGSNPGGHGGYGGVDQGGHGGSNQGGHGGSNQGGHGGSNQDEHGGYGGMDQGGHGEYGGSNQDGHGEYGGSNQGGHGESNEDGHGGSNQGGHGESNEDGHGGSNQGGHGESNEDGHGGSNQGGHGGSNIGEHGGSNQGGHGGSNIGEHGGYGGMNQGGHGEYGGSNQGGHGEYGGSNQGEHGGSNESGHGGSNQGEHKENGGVTKDEHGGVSQGGYGGAVQGGHGGVYEGGHGGVDEGIHGGLDQGGHGGVDEGIHGGLDQGGHGGVDEGIHGGLDQGGHGGVDEGGHGGLDQGGYGGEDEGGHGGVDQGGHGGANESGHDGKNQEGHGASNQDGHGGANRGGYEGSDQGGYGDSNEGGYVGLNEGGHTIQDAGDIKDIYTISMHDGYTKTDLKYPTASDIGYSPAPGVGIHTNAGGYSNHPSTIASTSGHQTSTINAGFAPIDTGVRTGISSGVYDDHTATTHYGGQTRPAVTYEIEETTSHGGYAASGNTGTTTYHGNFGSIGSQGVHGGSSYTDGSSGISSGFITGSYGGPQSATSAGSTTYHENFGSSGYTAGGLTGSISSGAASQGVIRTGDSTSGTVYAQSGASGTILSGSNEQGSIITDISQPSHVHTQSGTPGYVVTNGVKTIYDGSASKSTFAQGIHGNGAIITGAPASGVVLSGNSSPRPYLAGQNSAGVIIDGGVNPGVFVSDSTGEKYYTGGSGPPIYNAATGFREQSTFTSASKTPYYQNNPFTEQTWPVVIVGGGATSDKSFGSTGGEYYTGGSGSSVNNGAAGSRGHITFTSASNSPKFRKNPFTHVTGDLGYKTNEYHDNGGRGTIRYNNGEVTHKFTEDDVRDHRTQFGTYPTFDVGSYKASTANKGSFTKTGPTKTGIVTAQVGGSGTYVTGSTRPKPFSGTQNIGANAFGGTSSKSSSSLSYGTSTGAPDLRYTTRQPYHDAGSVDVSMINLGSTSGESSSGYSYTKPAVQLNAFDLTGSTKAPNSSGQKSPGFPSSPAPFLNVHVYNTPSVVTSAPITASPAVVNTYTYNKPSSVRYEQTVYQSANLPFSSGAAATGTYSRPIVTEQRKFPSVSSTVAPIAFTTGRIPASLSTIQPVIDTGYKTVVSPTPFSVSANTDGFGYSQSTGYRSDSLSTKSKSALDINVSFQPLDISTKKQPTGQQVTYESTGSYDYSEANDYNDYSHSQTAGTFGQKVSQGVSVIPTVNYAMPAIIIPPEIYNVPSSTITPAIGTTYREPFQIEQSTPHSTSRVPFGGYTYSKPSVKFVTSTVPSISYKQEGSYNSKITKSGGSSAELDSSRTKVEKLITNYDDRGSAKYTPSDYETYSDNTRNRYVGTSFDTNLYSGQQSYASTKTSFAGKSQSGVYSEVYSTTPKYKLNTDSLNSGAKFDSSSSYGISNSNLVTAAKNGAALTTTYLPISSSPSPGIKVSSSSRDPPSYSVTNPAVTTYSGGYKRGPSTPSYETSDTGIGKPKGKGKVIVKFSDLHPLLLGKLGAECTCKADPFASFRGSKPLPINSSKGRIDLRNYDESDIYVDLEASKEKEDYDSVEYNTYLKGSTPSNYDDERYETPVVAIFDSITPFKKGTLKSGRPSSNYLSGSSSSTYLPPSSTYLPAVSSTKLPSSSTHLPPFSTYLSSAASSNRGEVKASFLNNDGSIGASSTSAQRRGFRVGKNLEDSSSATGNALAGETLRGISDCARPGLFRHPNFCNKFYACHWDEWKKKFTLHVFNCPVHLTFDSGASACNWPSNGPACQDDNLLV